MCIQMKIPRMSLVVQPRYMVMNLSLNEKHPVAVDWSVVPYEVGSTAACTIRSSVRWKEKKKIWYLEFPTIHSLLQTNRIMESIPLEFTFPNIPWYSRIFSVQQRWYWLANLGRMLTCTTLIAHIANTWQTLKTGLQKAAFLSYYSLNSFYI